MSALFHLYLCGRIAAEWWISMKKKTLFLLLTLLWVFNACVGGWFLYRDYARLSTFSTDPAMLSHVLYMGTALLAALLTFLQYLRHRNDS